MTFTVVDITRCPGLNHYHLTYTIGGVEGAVELSKEELELDADDKREASVARCRSAVKEAGAVNFTQIRTALVGKVFKV